MTIQYLRIQRSVILLLFLSYFFVTPFFSMAYAYNIINIYNGIALPLVICLFSFPLLFMFKKTCKLNIIQSTYIFLLTMILLIQLIGYIDLYLLGTSSKILFDSFWRLTFNMIVLFYLGKNVSTVLESKKHIFIIIIMYISFLIMIFYGIKINENNLLQIKNPNGQYQTVADTFIIYSFLIFSLFKNSYFKIIMAILITLISLTLLSRASFYAAVITFILYLIISIFKKRGFKKTIIPLTTMSIFFFVFIKDTSLNTFSMSTPNRVLLILEKGLANDNSFSARQELFKQGLVDLKENWLLGNFMIEVKRDGESGNYMHNILSFFISYGIIPFLILVFLLFYSVIDSIKKQYMNDNKFSRFYLFYFLTGIFILTLLIFARSYFFIYIWFFLGMSFNAIKNNKLKEE